MEGWPILGIGLGVPNKMFLKCCYVPLDAEDAGIMTRRLGAELDPEMTAVLNSPAAPGSFTLAPRPNILR